MQKTNIFSKAAARIVSLILAGTLAVSAVCTGVMGSNTPRRLRPDPSDFHHCGCGRKRRICPH